MNDTTSKECPSGPSAWSIASQWVDPGAQSAPWWKLIGSQLCLLAQEARYPIEKQFEILLFLYAKVLPRVGPLNKGEKFNSPSRYTSLLTDDGTPFEYSWKWNNSTSSPDIRYCIEAIGSHTGSSTDPYNYLETEKLLTQDLASCVPGLDLTWFHHFVKAFGIDQRQMASNNPDAPKANMFVAFEHVQKGVVVKAYFLPAAEAGSGGPPTFETFASATRGVLNNTAALDASLDFVKNNEMGIDLVPDMLAVDCVDPNKSRLKLYVSTTATSFASIVSVMTLGGKITDVDRGIKELEVLLSFALGKETPISRDDELNVQSVFDKGLAHDFDLYGRMTYYFDIAPSSKLPDVKLYIPVIRFGRSDEAVASGLGQYLRLRQRDQFHDGFMRALGSIGAGHPEGSGHRLQTYLAVAFQRDGSLAITSYINPGVYHDDLKG
uniref:DMATS-type prenyltransferase fscG n=1 Tax=Fusarium equiseti TaxID=61235 RepID=FSCG_FUSEQ|nr:TPA_asm: DMATS-type prenyltransferase [Fusarium equiseti]